MINWLILNHFIGIPIMAQFLFEATKAMSPHMASPASVTCLTQPGQLDLANIVNQAKPTQPAYTWGVCGEGSSPRSNCDLDFRPAATPIACLQGPQPPVWLPRFVSWRPGCRLLGFAIYLPGGWVSCSKWLPTAWLLASRVLTLPGSPKAFLGTLLGFLM